MIKKKDFLRLKNIENVQKNLIRDNDNESIYYTPKSKFDDKDDKYKTNKTIIQTQNHQISLII